MCVYIYVCEHARACECSLALHERSCGCVLFTSLGGEAPCAPTVAPARLQHTKRETLALEMRSERLLLAAGCPAFHDEELAPLEVLGELLFNAEEYLGTFFGECPTRFLATFVQLKF